MLEMHECFIANTSADALQLQFIHIVMSGAYATLDWDTQHFF